ncbi:hypothetical protein [Nocardia sp. Marseille-Q1738]
MSTGGEVQPLTDAFVQYGAIGVIAAFFVYATVFLYKRSEAAHGSEIARIDAAHSNAIASLQSAHSKEVERLEDALDKERERSTRFEGNLSDLNQLINTQLAAQLVRATEAIREAADMRDHRRQ